MCTLSKVSASGYYKWLKRRDKSTYTLNDWLSGKILKYYFKFKGIYGVRRIHQEIEHDCGFHCDVKRIRRLMRSMGLKSVIRKPRKNYIPSKPEVTAQNLLDRKFKAENPNEKWLTDVTEFKYGINSKAYLSAILDLGDNSIVSFVLGHSNNNELVFKTFNLAIADNPEAKPMFHSDRGYQYTSKTFRNMLLEAGCTQSMSRVGKCLDNAPMEGFWGILKCEMYYLNKFGTYGELEKAITDYIHFYNNERRQAKYKGLVPSQVRKQALSA